jgi:predicted small integral membrane protein
MTIVRLSKIALVASVALTCSLAVFENIVDPQINMAFVRHVLSMDTIFPDSGIQDRSITNPPLQTIAFLLIVAGEFLTALFLCIGTVLMVRRLKAPTGRFAQAKTWAIVGLSLGFVVWQAGFLGIGGEWFGMWMSKTWNGQEAAFRFSTALLGILIYVSMPEPE